MERFKCIMIILLFVVAAFACAADGKAASSLLQEGLYAEEIDGDLDKAIQGQSRLHKIGRRLRRPDQDCRKSQAHAGRVEQRRSRSSDAA